MCLAFPVLKYVTCSRHDIAEKFLKYVTCSRHDIAEKFLSWHSQQSFTYSKFVKWHLIYTVLISFILVEKINQFLNMNENERK
jgi:hypothetical protein